mgnify:CR=1 FL=1
MLNLRDIDIVFLHGPHRPERKEHMEKTLFDLDHECYTGFSDQGRKSGTLGMLNILKKRLSQPFRPFLLLEDDCSRTQWFRYEIPVPDNSDAVYLGLSVYGIHPIIPQGYPNLISYTQTDNHELVRLQNMLSLHAVVYLSKQWTEMCLECFEKTFNNEPGSGEFDFDILICRNIPRFNVYALKEPLFYQDSKVGGLEAATYFKINTPSQEEQDPQS